jgi:hypothetical protein
MKAELHAGLLWDPFHESSRKEAQIAGLAR